jgi:hypothetical protein
MEFADESPGGGGDGDAPAAAPAAAPAPARERVGRGKGTRGQVVTSAVGVLRLTPTELLATRGKQPKEAPQCSACAACRATELTYVQHWRRYVWHGGARRGASLALIPPAATR